MHVELENENDAVAKLAANLSHRLVWPAFIRNNIMRDISIQLAIFLGLPMNSKLQRKSNPNPATLIDSTVYERRE